MPGAARCVSVNLSLGYCYYTVYGMDNRRYFRCSPATRDAQVVTELRADGKYETVLLGGRLDGERFITPAGPDEQHESAIELARIAAKEEER